MPTKFTMRRALFPTVAAAGILLSGCEQRITDANLQAVKPDMSTKEVEAILGPPRRVESPPESEPTVVKSLSITRYIYEQKGHKVQLTFVGDRLATQGVEGSFEK